MCVLWLENSSFHRGWKRNGMIIKTGGNPTGENVVVTGAWPCR